MVIFLLGHKSKQSNMVLNLTAFRDLTLMGIQVSPILVVQGVKLYSFQRSHFVGISVSPILVVRGCLTILCHLPFNRLSTLTI